MDFNKNRSSAMLETITGAMGTTIKVLSNHNVDNGEIAIIRLLDGGDYVIGVKQLKSKDAKFRSDVSSEIV